MKIVVNVKKYRGSFELESYQIEGQSPVKVHSGETVIKLRQFIHERCNKPELKLLLNVKRWTFDITKEELEEHFDFEGDYEDY